MSTPDRPTNVWRVCGRPVTDGPGAGCTCGDRRAPRRRPEPDPVEQARRPR